MTFLERYAAEQSWHGKVIVMGIFHLAMSRRNTKWTIADTAREFGVSSGLVSENLRLSDAIDRHVDLTSKCKSRAEALHFITGR